MKRTIIYVFGPKRLESLYYSNNELEQKDGGWLKIGQTSSDDDVKDKREAAIDRINQEVKTGIPEVCKLFDVFEYPEQKGQIDNTIRNLLTDDIYNLECSKTHNKTVKQNEIKAGREFVYGASRSQVLSAVAKFERNLILQNYGKDGFDTLMSLILNNSTDASSFEDEEEANSTAPTTKLADCDKLWDAVIARINTHINAPISNTAGRPYIDIKSPTQNGFTYNIGYSVRRGTVNVAISTDKGENAKDAMISYIEDHDIRSHIPNITMKQGVKNKGKWAWSTSDTLDKSFDELVDWFANTILTFYNAFEKSATL